VEDASNSLHSEGEKAAELNVAGFLTYHNRESLAECRKAADISCIFFFIYNMRHYRIIVHVLVFLYYSTIMFKERQF